MEDIRYQTPRAFLFWVGLGSIILNIILIVRAESEAKKAADREIGSLEVYNATHMRKINMPEPKAINRAVRESAQAQQTVAGILMMVGFVYIVMSMFFKYCPRLFYSIGLVGMCAFTIISIPFQGGLTPPFAESAFMTWALWKARKELR